MKLISRRAGRAVARTNESRFLIYRLFISFVGWLGGKYFLYIVPGAGAAADLGTYHKKSSVKSAITTNYFIFPFVSA